MSTASQAGQGSGNAHGAATAGMTYQGDPVSGPSSPLPPRAWTPYSSGSAMGRASQDEAPSPAAPQAKER